MPGPRVSLRELIPAPKIAPSLLSADFRRLEDQVKMVERAGAEILHFDIMDGHFVPNLTFGPLVIRWMRQVTDMTFMAHLMVDNPESLVEPVIDAGADMVVVHVESSKNMFRLIQSIKDRGVRVGIALNPATPLTHLTYLLGEIDSVLIMCVDPGFGGQKFIPSMMDKIRRLRKALVKRKLPLDIAVDGGINHENVGAVVEAGASTIIAGTAIFGQSSVEDAVRRLKEECLEAYERVIGRLAQARG